MLVEEDRREPRRVGRWKRVEIRLVAVCCFEAAFLAAVGGMQVGAVAAGLPAVPVYCTVFADAVVADVVLSYLPNSPSLRAWKRPPLNEQRSPFCHPEVA